MPTDIQATGKTSPDVDAVVIGAGFAGLYVLHRLRELGLSVQGYEAGSDVGGTWYWNRYPGARTDSLHSIYCFTFSPELASEWSWKERYPGQEEVLAYLETVADKFDLRPSFRFNSRVQSARFDEATGLWTVELADGETITTTYLVPAVGILSAPNLPQITGLDAFAGESYHTGLWPHDGVDFSGKRVAVIGAGATAVQAIPHIAAQAEHLTVFQRTPNYVVPNQNHELDPAYQEDLKARYHEIWKKARQHAFSMPFTSSGLSALALDDAARQQIYEEGWQKGGFHFLFETFDDLLVDEAANETACEFIRAKIRDVVHDPAVAERLSPYGYPYGAKRPPMGTNYYETYNRPNVTLIDVRADPITEITPSGVRTASADHEFDVIVYATGFDASTGALTRMDIRGRNGISLADEWRNGPLTHLGMSSAGFPNLLMVNGPLSPFANAPSCVEQSVQWITQCIDYLRRNGIASIEASEEAQQEWARHVTEVANRLLAAKGEAVNTWFAGANIEGKAHAINLYFGGSNIYFDKCEQVAAEGYPGFVLDAAGTG